MKSALGIRSETNENVYMSQGAWQNDTVTQTFTQKNHIILSC